MFCEYCTEFIGLDCTLPARCDVYMCPVLSLHYCHRNVLCISSLCCTTASVVCHVCLVRIALLPVQGAMYFLFKFSPLPAQGAMYVLLCVALPPVHCAMYVLFVVQYCQCSVLCMSCLCWTTASTGYYVCLACVCTIASAGCYVFLVSVALLPGQCAAVESAIAVSRAEATISPLFIFIFILFVIFTHSH